jgi:signal transduction histidine kinase
VDHGEVKPPLGQRHLDGQADHAPEVPFIIFKDISGSGIGLSVAAELARAHGGRLTAASQPGHRTTMTLTVPGA